MPGPIRGQNIYDQSIRSPYLPGQQTVGPVNQADLDTPLRGLERVQVRVDLGVCHQILTMIHDDDDDKEKLCLTSEISLQEVWRVSPATGSLTHPKGSLASWIKSVSPDLGIKSSRWLRHSRAKLLLGDSHGEQVQVGRVNHPGVARPVIQPVAQSHAHLVTTDDGFHSLQNFGDTSYPGG